MKLYIDTSDATKTILEVGAKRYEKSGKHGMAQQLLAILDDALKNQKKSLADITEIEVAVGPGSYTGLRVGVAVAQSLGYSLGVKVNGKDVSKDSIQIDYGSESSNPHLV